MQVDFYHVAGPVHRVIAAIAGRILGDGGRLLVVLADDAAAAALDEALWAEPADGFLPHARMGAGREADQPVLIAPAPDPVNGARHILLADGVWRDEALRFDRAFHLFDDDTIVQARATWKALATHDGLTRNFWRQEGGRWAKVA